VSLKSELRSLGKFGQLVSFAGKSPLNNGEIWENHRKIIEKYGKSMEIHYKWRFIAGKNIEWWILQLAIFDYRSEIHKVFPRDSRSNLTGAASIPSCGNGAATKQQSPNR
jgi:hypothetical protein